MKKNKRIRFKNNDNLNSNGKMIKRFSIFMLLTVCSQLFPQKINAQTADNNVISLAELIKKALESNQTVRKARLDIENSNYKINEVRSATLPQISGSAGINYNPLLQQSALPGDFFGQPGTTVLVALGQEWNANAGISLNQVIFNQSVFTGLKAAATTREFYKINSQLTEENIIEQISSGYYGVLVQRQQLSSIDSTIQNTKKLLNILQSQLQNGLVKKLDVDRVAVTISNLESRKQQLKNAIILLENQLKFLAGIPINSNITFAEIDINSISIKSLENKKSDFSHRSESKLLQTQKRLLELQLKSYKSEYYPTLSLMGNYSYQGLGNEFLFSAPSDKVNWFSVGTIGLNLRVPLFNGFATSSRVQQSNIALKKLQEDMSLTEQSMSLGYENAVTQINNNLLVLNSQKQNTELAKEVYKTTIENFNNGLASLTDLLSAENGLTDAQNNYLATLLNYRISEIQLLKAQGELIKLLE